MSENILSIEDLKFLEELHSQYGILYFRYNDDEVFIDFMHKIIAPESMDLLMEISKKLKYRLNSNFQMNFHDKFQFDVVRV